MRVGFVLAWTLLASAASAQRFGFTHQMLPAENHLTQAVALGDIDGDGDLDAFLGVVGQDRLYLNDGTGISTDASASNLPPVPFTSTGDVALGDLDGDGDLDVFLGAAGQSRLYSNGGTGVFTDVTATSLPALTAAIGAVALGDLDGDGDLDAFLGINGQDLLYLNSGTGVFTDATATSLPALGDVTTAVAMGDVDGDGDLDAFVGNQFQENRLYLNGGTGNFADVTATNLPVLLEFTNSVALGDVDGDGDLDSFVGNQFEPSRLYQNGGTGFFADVTATNLPALSDNTLAVAFGDVDGDGDLDALVGNSWPQSRLYLNGGTGVFADVTATSLPGRIDNALADVLGDVDGDGDLDAFLGRAGQSRLLLNGGTGVFTDVTATNLPLLTTYTYAVALGDVDGDGNLDGFMGNDDWQQRLYLNGGTGVFTDVTATNLPALSGTTRAVALGDVDGDGDLDVFMGNAGRDQNRLCLNGGAGVFTDVTATSLPAQNGDTRAVALGDVDGDGDLDAYVGNSGQDRLYVNGGAGVFADLTAANLPNLTDLTHAVALGDLDGDGDLDAFTGNDIRQTRLYVNLSRQVAGRGIPRAGKPLTLDLFGPPTGSWLLAASDGSADVALPPFGSLRLYPPTLFVVAGGTLDPQGRASLTFPVPANPALVGLSLYWQAVVGPPLRFTNLEVTTVTAL